MPRAYARQLLKPNLLLVVGAALIGLLGLEAGLRAKLALESQSFEEALASRPRIGADGRATLGQMIRPTGDRRLYELIPGLHVNFTRADVSINADGFRGALHPRKKPPGTVRLVGLGDSVMFGWGVDDGLDYLSVLERRLNEREPKTAWEVVNTAVPGYNTVMEVETLKRRGLAYAPDIVILGYCVNDLSLPQFVQAEPDVFSWRRSFLGDFLRERLARPGSATRRDGGEAAGDDPFADEARPVPDRYQDMVGLLAFSRAVTELRALGQEHGFDVVVLFFWSAPATIRRIVEPLGFRLVDTRAAMKAFLERAGVRELRGSALSLSREDSHPSALGHELIAGSLYDGLRAAGLLERARARAPIAPAAAVK